MRTLRNLAKLWYFCLLLPISVSPSSGDRSEVFKACVSRCETELCSSTKTSPALTLPLRLTRWSCGDNCRYTCMHAVTDEAIRNRDYVHQYFGKWPFWRFVGMQEPASVVFSLLNLWAHIQGLKWARAKIPADHPIRRYYLGWGLVNLNAWLWSAVFHTRDTPTTEKLDYFSAGLAILYSLFYTVVRLFHLYGHPQERLVMSHSYSHQLNPPLISWGVLCVVLYILHVSYLVALPRFDYTYNMAANLAVGVLHNLLWISYAIPRSIVRAFPLRHVSYRPKHAYKAVLFAFLTMGATSLELFDFPPWWRVLDAHALWHLSTVPLVSFWWTFMIEDALDDGWKGGKQ